MQHQHQQQLFGQYHPAITSMHPPMGSPVHPQIPPGMQPLSPLSPNAHLVAAQEAMFQSPPHGHPVPLPPVPVTPVHPRYIPNHHADWYSNHNDSDKLKRTLSESAAYPQPHAPPQQIQHTPQPPPTHSPSDQGQAPPPQHRQSPPLQAMHDRPAIIDDADDMEDHWDFITEIVNENKIPDLPPERPGNADKDKDINLDLFGNSPLRLPLPADDVHGIKEVLGDDEKEPVVDLSADTTTKQHQKQEMAVAVAVDVDVDDHKEDDGLMVQDKDKEEEEEMVHKEQENVDVYAMIFETMNSNDTLSKDKEVAVNQSQMVMETEDFEDDHKAEEMIPTKISEESQRTPPNDEETLMSMEAMEAMDAMDMGNADETAGPSVSFADLSDVVNAPQSDDAFTPKVN